MTEKQRYLKEYINNLAISLNKQYRGILPEEKVEKSYDMFKDSPKDITEILKEIDRLKEDLIREYLIRKKQEKEMFSYHGNTGNDNIKNRIPMISINEIDLDNALFHFHPREFYEEVQNHGLQPRIGDNANGIEKTEKVFFSKGIDGVLKLWDVWLKWEMKHAFNGDNKYPGLFKNAQERADMENYWHQNVPANGDYKEIKNFFYNFPEKYKQKFFDIIILQKIQNQDYYILDIEDGKEYDSNGIDENKQKLKEDYESIDPKDYAKQHGQIKIGNQARLLYGSYSFDNVYMDNWNMHTKVGIGIEKEKIKQLQTKDGATDVLSILLDLHDIAKTKETPEYFEQFDILEDFIDHTKKTRGSDEKKQEQIKTKPSREQEIDQLKSMKSKLIKVQSKDNSNNTNDPMQNSSNSFGENQQERNTLKKGKQRTIGSYPKNNSSSQSNGFVDKLVVTLITGFVLGSISIVGYLVINVGKYTFVIQ